MTTPDTKINVTYLCHACEHTAIIKSTGDTTTTEIISIVQPFTGVTRYYCANCYTKVINSFTHRPKYNRGKKSYVSNP